MLETQMTIPLADLQETFYVRQTLNQARVEFFADLYTSKGQVELPLAGSLDGEETIHLIDGRHRKHALLGLEVAATECRLRVYGTWPDMVVAAVQANWGGALPQTEGDLRHTVKMLLEHDVGRNTLYAKFGFIPRGMMRKLLDGAQADIAAAKMRKALNAVAAEELKPTEAAERFGVEVADLKRKIAGEKKVERPGQAQIKSNISNRFKETAGAIGRQLSAALKMYESAELTETGFKDVIAHIRRLLKKVESGVDNYEARFQTLAGKSNQDKSAAAASNKSGALGKSALEKMGL